MNRRYFFQALTSGLVAATSAELFLPKLVKPAWRPARALPAHPFGAPLYISMRAITEEIKDELGFPARTITFGSEIKAHFAGPAPKLTPGDEIQLRWLGFNRLIRLRQIAERHDDKDGCRFELTGTEVWRD